MVLYKYVSFTSAQRIIESSTIGFSCLEDLNDPFEGKGLKFKQKNDTKMPESVMLDAIRNKLSRNFGVLSLTRQPLNTLMWSHYGLSHTGVVLGIDVEKAKLTCEKTSVIPAQFGEIIYTQSKPDFSLDELNIHDLMKLGEEIETFNTHSFQLFKQAFLYKSNEWVYEEEVRVVKNIRSRNSRYTSAEFKNESGNWKQFIIEGRPLYCLEIPKDSIKEVYLGASTYKNVTRLDVTDEKYVKIVEAWKKLNIEVYNCKPTKDSWDLERYTHEIIKL